MNTFTAAVHPLPDAIAELTDRVLAYLRDRQVEGRAAHHVALIVEELVTNIGAHGDSRDEPVRITLAVEPNRVTGEVVDRAAPFDPHLAPAPDLDSGADERRVGGLGLFLVRRFAESLEYERRNGENCTKFAVPRAQPSGGSNGHQ
jgi:anti-sigma regulatory factor (Ser/Thr protein kinase)